MSHDRKFPSVDAMVVAGDICKALAPHCERLMVAGSLRRLKPMVGDVEILFVPKLIEKQVDLFSTKLIPATDDVIATLLDAGVLEKRPSKIGVFTWGPENKLAIHKSSGIPVDLFATTQPKWWNSVVCRTGGKENNLLITTTAQRQGWSFEAYGSGFRRLNNSEHHDTTSERDVFEFIGLEYLEPWDRK